MYGTVIVTKPAKSKPQLLARKDRTPHWHPLEPIPEDNRRKQLDPQRRSKEHATEENGIWDDERWFRSILHFWVQPSRPTTSKPTTTHRFERPYKETLHLYTALPKHALYSTGSEGSTVVPSRTHGENYRPTQAQTFSDDGDLGLPTDGSDSGLRAGGVEKSENGSPVTHRTSRCKNSCTRRTFSYEPARDIQTVCQAWPQHNYSFPGHTQAVCSTGGISTVAHSHAHDNRVLVSDGPEGANSRLPPATTTVTTTTDTAISVATTTSYEAVRKRRHLNRRRRRGELNRDDGKGKGSEIPATASVTGCAVNYCVPCFPVESNALHVTVNNVLCCATGSPFITAHPATTGRSFKSSGSFKEANNTRGGYLHVGKGPARTEDVTDQYYIDSGVPVSCPAPAINTVTSLPTSDIITTCGVVSVVIKDIERVIDIDSLCQRSRCDSKRPDLPHRLKSDSANVSNTVPHRSMIPMEVSESVAIVKVPNYAEHSAESRLEYSDMRRYKHEVKFEPFLAPVRYANTLIVYGKNTTRKRFVSRTFYEPRVKPRRFADTDFVFQKDKQQRFASFVDYHIDECRKWFKTSLELKAKTFTTVHTVPGHDTSTKSVTSSREVNSVRHDVTLPEGPGASQVFIPPRKQGEGKLGEMQFRVALEGKDKMDINMNGPLLNGL